MSKKPNNPLRVPVESAFLHSVVMIPGAMQSLETLTAEKAGHVSLFMTPQGLLLEAKGKVAIVPFTNVKIMVLAVPEEEAA